MKLAQLPGAPFDYVLDVGGNVGDFAELAVEAWPEACVISLEPLPGAANASRERSRGRWLVHEVAASEHPDRLPLRFCLNQHTASTMQRPGTARREHFGIEDRYETITVSTLPLDRFLPSPFSGLSDSALALPDSLRLLVKIDVEGHELHVLRGARRTLDQATTVVCEVQQNASIFLGSPTPAMVDAELRRHGLFFAGLADAFLSPVLTVGDGSVLQFDGIWTRDAAPLREAH